MSSEAQHHDCYPSFLQRFAVIRTLARKRITLTSPCALRKRRKFMLTHRNVIAASAIALSLVGTSALAQSDGSTAVQAAVVPLAAVNVSCGAQIANLVRTENTAITFSNTAFSALPNSGV